MGKATGLSSQFRGKVGNVIGYLTKNRAGRYEQSVKGYQPVVANPQSFAQALARVPVGPTQRICSALLPLIQRGWEGVAYGDAAKSEFLSYNLKNFRGPYLEKGSPYVVPGPMLITRGSLRSIGINGFERWGIVTDIFIDEEDYTFANIGELSRMLMYDNEWIKEGEQWTIVICRPHGEEFTYSYVSFFIDTRSTEQLPDNIGADTTSDKLLQFNLYSGEGNNGPAAAAIIRSQPYGETSFRRSTTFLTCNSAYNLYNTEDDVRRAVASYRDGEDPEDWEDDPTPEYQKIAYLCMVTVTSDMVSNWQAQWENQFQCLGYMTRGGTAGIFFSPVSGGANGVLLDAQAKPILYDNTAGHYLLYNTAYLYAREYSSAYGVIDEV